ncbi:vomeronasal type-2 receptor 26-like [Spea bombifrons]|uniref:vomeronasal type-2 receptor 26-like n=1 Tax=Spea bombifrons TaxID=233779 RepID=UPI002349E872|nr:vomeronasal type-2 receptor 26-like [Spea bombifrons]
MLFTALWRSTVSIAAVKSVAPLCVILLYFSRIVFQSPAPACSLQLVQSYEDYDYFQDGDIIIGAVFTVNSYVVNIDYEKRPQKILFCVRPNPRDYINILLFLFSIEHVNLDPNILPNITLGYHLYDSCLDARKAVKSIIQILSGPKKTIPNYSCMDSNRVAGFIGDQHAITTVPIAQVLGVYGYAQISYGASDYELDNRRVHSHFFQTWKNNHIHLKVICQLLKYFGWTWVGILTSDDDNGEKETQELVKYMAGHGICVAYTVKINLSDGMRHIIKRKIEIVQKSSAEVIILCGSFSLAILDVIIGFANMFTDKTMILPPSWASNFYLTDYYIEALNGTLAVDLRPAPLPDTGDFFPDIHPSNNPKDKLLEDIWITDFNCLSENSQKNKMYSKLYKISLHNCTGEKYAFIKNYVYTAVSSHVFYSVLAMANALHYLHLNLKEYSYNHQIFHHIKKVKSFLESGGSFFNEKLKEFGFCFSIVNWKPRSQCSENCLPGYRKVLRPGTQICCYDCVQCSEGEISNRSDSENCMKCPDTEWSNEMKEKCIPKLVEFLSYTNDAISIVLSCSSVLLCVLTLVILIIFTVYRDTPVVKANNKNLSFLLLVSLMLSFLCVFLFLGRPEDVTCMLRQTAFGVLFSLAVSSVLGKTIMIYIVFKATKPGSSWANWVSTKVSNSIVLLCSSIQVIINISWLSISPPFQELDMRSYQGKIIIQCNEGSVIAFYCVLGYMGLLAAVSFIIAFLARTLPDSFNEAKYITFSMLVFCSVWIAMIPAYLSTKGKNMVAVEIFAILASSAGLLMCIFFPKCYIILFRPKKNTKLHLLGSKTKNVQLVT